MRKPRVFVSSTCYDLTQVRDDLKAFIEGEVGYEAVLSEYPSFPVDPDQTTIENSRSAVRNNADIFVLLVGGRYGTVDKNTDRSITNNEYSEAVMKRLPVYSFVLKAVDTLLPAWQENPELTPPQVESPRVFEFVRQLKEALTWVYPFEYAKDIIEVLRVQWAYLQMDGLDKRRLLADAPVAERLGLRGKALEVALRKEELWEYMLYAELLTRELDERAPRRRDLALGFSTGITRHLDDRHGFGEWVQRKIDSSLQLINGINQITSRLGEAFGAPGQPGDIELIVYSASRLGTIYGEAIDWALEFHQISVPDELAKLRQLLSHMLDDVIASFAKHKDAFTTIVEQAQAGELSGQVELDWVVTISDEFSDAVSAEMERLGVQ